MPPFLTALIPKEPDLLPIREKISQHSRVVWKLGELTKVNQAELTMLSSSGLDRQGSITVNFWGPCSQLAL